MNKDSAAIAARAKQIVIPMIRQQYDENWQDVERLRAFVDEWAELAPEMFPEGFDQGDCLHGFGRESRSSRPETAEDRVGRRPPYWLRPSFVTSSMTGTSISWRIPCSWRRMVFPWLLKIGFGHTAMYWYRVIERLGRNSLVGTTVRDAAQLPEHLVADQHHADWAGQKGYIPTTVGGGWILGVALTAAADHAHLQEAYGVFAAEARDVPPSTLLRRSTPTVGRRRRMFSRRCFPDHGGGLFCTGS